MANKNYPTNGEFGCAFMALFALVVVIAFMLVRVQIRVERVEHGITQIPATPIPLRTP